jgi:hypothetical protein
MTFASHIALRLLALTVCFAALAPEAARAHGGTGDACTKWRQNRLIIGFDLQSRHFELEAKAEDVLKIMPPFKSAEGRTVFQKPFSLTLDLPPAAHVKPSIFESSAPRSCVIARDRERTQAMKIPVFFVGRAGESQEELEKNAGSAEFAPSSALDIGGNFADVSFHLKRAGSRFDEIRPFFLCGLAGLLVCETSCPEASDTLAASLVNDLVSHPPALKEATAPPTETPKPERPLNTPPPKTPPKERVDVTPPKEEHPTPTPSETKPIPPAKTTPDTPPKPEPATPTTPPDRGSPSVPAQPQPQLKRLVLAFERRSGEALPPADVLKAEETLNIEGTPLSVAMDGLAADLKEEAFNKANDEEYLKRLFRRHQILNVKKDPSRLLLTVEPLYVRAEDLSIRIRDAAGDFVRGCDLALEVAPERRFGEGWAKLGERERARGLRFVEADTHYELDLPIEIEPDEMLIGAAEPGSVGRLTNTAPGCELEARPVSVEEARSRRILRPVQRTGPILISVLSAGSGFAGAVSSTASEGFWTEALKLVNTVSAGAWEKKILARAQAPGASLETRILEVETDGAPLAGEGASNSFLKELSEGSRLLPEPLSIIQIRAIERFHLDLALKVIRGDTSISPQHSVKQEALLIISGSVKDTGSYFCQHSVRRDKSPWASPQWVKQARKTFALEVWGNAAVQAMTSASRIKPAEGAPDGVYVCNIPGADGNRIALYGIASSIVTDNGARAAAFSYLAPKAQDFLKP